MVLFWQYFTLLVLQNIILHNDEMKLYFQLVHHQIKKYQFVLENLELLACLSTHHANSNFRVASREQ